jgi:hypothetical protein
MKNLKDLKLEQIGPPPEKDWLLSRKIDTGVNGSGVCLVVTKGTGAHLGETRVELGLETENSLEMAVPLELIDELKLFYALSHLKSERQERQPADHPPRKEERRQAAPTHRPQPQQQPGRIVLPDSLPVGKRPAQVVARVVTPARTREEEQLLYAITSAGLSPPTKALSSMVKEEIFSYLSREVGGPLVYKGRELTVDEAANLDFEILFDCLVESKAAARS